MENKIQLFEKQQVRPVAQRRHFINRRFQSAEIIRSTHTIESRRDDTYILLTPKINIL